MFIDNGFSDFISKTIDVVDLDTILEKWLPNSKQKKFIVDDFAKNDEDTTETEKQKESRSNDADSWKANSVAGLNVTKWFEWFGGDETSYMKLLRAFTPSLRLMLESIEIFSEDGLAHYELTVHSVKGTSLDIGATQIGNDASELEAAAKVRNLDYINEHHSVFFENAWKLVNDLEEMFAAIDVDSKKTKTIKDKPDDEALSRLFAASKVYDMDAADEVMAEIDSYQYESDDGLVDWLRQRVDMVEFDQITEKFTEYFDK
jgi:hypothetical protein